MRLYHLPRVRLPRIEMEYKELMEKKAYGSRAGIEKELTDLAAACICALKKIKHM